MMNKKIRGLFMPYFDPSEVHIIERNDLNILFLKKNLKFYQISEETKDKIKAVIQKQEPIIDNSPLTEIELFQDGKNLNILLLNVANDCNLRCSYCYNKHGTYGESADLMSEEIAIKAIDLVFQHFDKVHNIQFFGGEPLLNTKIIRLVCEYVTEKVKNMSGMMPRFGLNTNGTILNDSIIELIKKYKIVVSVSLDGNKEIHDLSRVDLAGKGTYHRVINNIAKIQETTGMLNCIEVTYNINHVKKGVKVFDIIDDFRNNLKLQTQVHISPVAVDCTKYPLVYEDWQSFVELIKREFKKLRAGQEPFLTVAMNLYLRRLLNQESHKLFCLAGFSKLAVNSSGNIYPCNGLACQENMKIAHVDDSPHDFAKKLAQKQKYLASLRKTTFFKDCRTCWIYNVCTYCMIYLLRDGVLDLTQLNSQICMYNRMIVEELVVQLTICKQNKTHWDLLKKYIEK